MKKVVYSSLELGQLRKHRSEAATIIAKPERYALSGAGDVKWLAGRSGKRLRCGDFRVIFEEADNEIHVLGVGPRGDIYR